MQIEIDEIESQLTKLLAAVERGERVTVSRDGKPLMDCVPAEPAKPFPFGFLGPPPSGEDTEYMVGPTDDETLDEMGL